MENASEALIMAFGVLIFVIALTVAMNSFNQVKRVSDIVLYTADETNYYDYQGATGKASQNRIVGLETIIPTLYKYYKENYSVLFRKGKYLTDEQGNYTGEFSNLEPLIIYTTPSRYSNTVRGEVSYLWGTKDKNISTQSTYDTLMHKKYDEYFDKNKYTNGSHGIFSFDLDEETMRREPWTGMYYKARENLNCLLNGTDYNNPNDGKTYIAYKKQFINGSFIQQYSGKQFVETVGEYTYSGSQSIESDTEDEVGEQIGSTISSNANQKKKRIVIFTLID